MSYKEFQKEQQEKELRHLLSEWKGLRTTLKFMVLHAPGGAERFEPYLKTAREKIKELEKQIT